MRPVHHCLSRYSTQSLTWILARFWKYNISLSTQSTRNYGAICTPPNLVAWSKILLASKKGTNTIVFIACDEIPITRLKDDMYGHVCVNSCPEKDDPNCTHLTVGGNRVNFPGDCGTPTVDMVRVKPHLSSVISTKGARYCTIDLKEFYLMTPMACLEYMCMKLKGLPKDFVLLYNLVDKVTSYGFVYINIQKGMYGLPQAGILAQELLEYA